MYPWSLLSNSPTLSTLVTLHQELVGTCDEEAVERSMVKEQNFAWGNVQAWYSGNWVRLELSLYSVVLLCLLWKHDTGEWSFSAELIAQQPLWGQSQWNSWGAFVPLTLLLFFCLFFSFSCSLLSELNVCTTFILPLKKSKHITAWKLLEEKSSSNH